MSLLELPRPIPTARADVRRITMEARQDPAELERIAEVAAKHARRKAANHAYYLKNKERWKVYAQTQRAKGNR